MLRGFPMALSAGMSAFRADWNTSFASRQTASDTDMIRYVCTVGQLFYLKERNIKIRLRVPRFGYHNLPQQQHLRSRLADIVGFEHCSSGSASQLRQTRQLPVILFPLLAKPWDPCACSRKVPRSERLGGLRENIYFWLSPFRTELTQFWTLCSAVVLFPFSRRIATVLSCLSSIQYPIVKQKHVFALCLLIRLLFQAPTATLSNTVPRFASYSAPPGLPLALHYIHCPTSGDRLRRRISLFLSSLSASRYHTVLLSLCTSRHTHSSLLLHSRNFESQRLWAGWSRRQRAGVGVGRLLGGCYRCAAACVRFL